MAEQAESDFPKIAAPARRALANAGYTRLDQLTKVRRSEIAKLHGMGRKALDQLGSALADRGQSFADER
jgi:hypothetical protein